MNLSQKQLIERAIGALKLRDVILHEARFRRPVPTPEQSQELEARQQFKRAVKFKLGEAPADPETAAVVKLLQVYVELGLRITADQDENPPIYFEIEADFMVEYQVNAEIDGDAIKAFADFNSVHNVWPFWRQHVYDVVSRGRLPHLDVPLFSGIASE